MKPFAILRFEKMRLTRDDVKIKYNNRFNKYLNKKTKKNLIGIELRNYKSRQSLAVQKFNFEC